MGALVGRSTSHRQDSLPSLRVPLPRIFLYNPKPERTQIVEGVEDFNEPSWKCSVFLRGRVSRRRREMEEPRHSPGNSGCAVAVAASKIDIPSSCHRVTRCLDIPEGFCSRLQLLKGLDSATFIFCDVTRNEEEQGVISGISALGRTGGVGELGLPQQQLWRKGLL